MVNQCNSEDIFSDGDGTLPTKKLYKLRAMAYISAYLFADEPMLAQARDMLSNNAFKNDSIELTSAMCVALTGMSDITPAEDKYEGMNLIQYNDAPVGQHLVHKSWDDPNSASVFMKIKERNAGGHDHLDSGTFMIYYKGMLVGTPGWSDLTGSVTVTNHSNAKISVVISFEQLSVPNGTATLNISGGEFELDSAAGVTYQNAPSKIVAITVDGVPSSSGVIGTIRVKIDSAN